MRVFSWS